MPEPISTIAAGTQLVGGLINAISAGRQNKKNRNFAREMYARQHGDSIAFWNMQNAYNDPSAQMKRLQAAGLNPALIYGSNAGGSSGNASPIKTPDAQSAQTRVPEWGNAISGAGSMLMQMYDLDIKQAQIDNLRTDNTVKLEEAALKEAQRANIQQNTKRSQFDLDLDSELRQISADARRENLRKLKADVQFTLNEDERKAAMNAQTIIESAERVLQLREQTTRSKQERQRIRADINRIKNDTELKRLDIELRKNGINPSDPMWARMLGRILGNYADSQERKPYPGTGNKASRWLWNLSNK